ncbi:hypothetical protein BC827DRAFT_852759 [Russula dissimulans]|nr:hypothetical protein BC827DRAFT_852759 [Russula dissimulans]
MKLPDDDGMFQDTALLMPFNLPATLFPCTPSPPFLSLSAIYLNFAALRDAGYRGAMSGKAMAALPNNDKVIPELEARLLPFNEHCHLTQNTYPAGLAGCLYHLGRLQLSEHTPSSSLPTPAPARP